MKYDSYDKYMNTLNSYKQILETLQLEIRV